MERRIAAGAAWTAASNWIEQALAFAVFVAIARFIGADAFGVAAMALAFIMLGEVLLRDTLAEGLISADAVERGREDAVFWALIAFGAALVAALAFAAPFAAKMFGDARVAPVMQAMAPTCIFVAISGVPTAKLRRDMAFKTLAIRAIAGVVCGGAVGLYMAANGYGAWSLVGQRLALTGVNAVLAATGARWLPAGAPWSVDYSLVKGLGPRVVALRSLTIVIMQTPVVALGVVSSASSVAMYSFAARIVEIVIFLIVAPLKRVIQPAAAAMRQAGGDTRSLFADVTAIAALAAFALFAGLAFVGQTFIDLTMGEEWRLAGAIIAPLCAAGALTALIEIQEGYLLALDRSSRFCARHSPKPRSGSR
ncbi:MAG: oligosaccharide flippase family protein [Parvularculaceae bacterium]